MWDSSPKLSAFRLAFRFMFGLGVWTMGILFLLPASNTGAAPLILGWDASPSPDVTGYKLYYGLASRDYTVNIDVGMSLTAALSDLVPDNTYFFAATAYDRYGQESAFSNVTSYAVPAGDTAPPTVSITLPLDGTVVKPISIVTISASASDDVGVTMVEFYVNGNLRCAVATSPYTCVWRVPKRSGTLYRLRAKAYDAAGNIGSSSIVKLTSQ